MLNRLSTLRSKKKKKSHHQAKSNLNLESLEKREMFIVGAFGLPAVAGIGTGFDGVVELSGPAGGCTGSLLSSGRHILTAAHCVDNNVDTNGDGLGDRGDRFVDPGTYTISFDMSWGRESYQVPAGNISVPTGNFNGLGNWNGKAKDGRDIAVIELDKIAPHGAERYHPYEGRDEEGRWGFIVGYGRTGRGNNRVNIDDNGDGVTDRRGCDASSGGTTKRIGTNFFDDTDGPGNSELEFDFDSNTNNWVPGSTPGNSNNRLNEIGPAGGDSGGPGMLWGPTGLEVAAVGSRGSSSRCTGSDYDYTRVSSWAGWIHQQMASADDIVLDMNQQPGNNNGSSDYIHVNDSNGTLTITIDGELVHDETLANVNSLTILGSSWGEHFTINLNHTGLDYNVDGRGGADHLMVITGSNNDSMYVYRNYILTQNSRVDYSRVERLTVNSGNGNDYVQVSSTNLNVPVTVYANRGDDRVYVGSNLNSVLSDITVNGGAGNDRLTVRDYQSSANTYSVASNNISVNRKANWETTYSSVETVALETGSGNDTINSSANSYWLTTIIRSGYGNDTFNGGAGREIFFGGSGNDTIRGGGGRDILIGGHGADTLDGQAGDDILIDGYTSYDYNDVALKSLMDEWKSNRSYTQRIANLRNGGGSNGNYKLNSNTIGTDYYADTLTGGSGRDWFHGDVPPVFRSIFDPTVYRDSATDRVWLDWPANSIETVN